MLDKLDVQTRVNISLFLLALKRKYLSLCFSGCIKVCKMMGSVLKYSDVGMWDLKVVQEL
jgi:hypothetical protein